MKEKDYIEADRGQCNYQYTKNVDLANLQISNVIERVEKHFEFIESIIRDCRECLSGYPIECCKEIHPYERAVVCSLLEWIGLRVGGELEKYIYERMIKTVGDLNLYDVKDYKKLVDSLEISEENKKEFIDNFSRILRGQQTKSVVDFSMRDKFAHLEDIFMDWFCTNDLKFIAIKYLEEMKKRFWKIKELHKVFNKMLVGFSEELSEESLKNCLQRAKMEKDDLLKMIEELNKKEQQK